ncbi:hypothetical protein [Rufibacter tibetensis]|uniref:Uncharacterized protein n=1 Tax=Rufibacter tibetensis TaxID=512763 RepID=A0A0N7HW27_9BACT|nr:hypothetical protein [Rufibacter tibetensis]ALI98080.1 hypothetical protein DC20_02680 [Rufibacter tibetensis]
MEKSITTQVDANKFLEMWKSFNELAQESGIVKTALQKYEKGNSNWLNYLLYANNYQVIGQTLLVHCLREKLDIAATDYFSNFDLTGYALEPEQEYHDEEAGVVRQALDDVDVLQFARVHDTAELKRVLPKLMKSEGVLKILILPVLEEAEQEQYKEILGQKLSKVAVSAQEEYLALFPMVKDEQVKWHYIVYGGGHFAIDTCL